MCHVLASQLSYLHNITHDNGDLASGRLDFIGQFLKLVLPSRRDHHLGVRARNGLVQRAWESESKISSSSIIESASALVADCNTAATIRNSCIWYFRR